MEMERLLLLLESKARMLPRAKKKTLDVAKNDMVVGYIQVFINFYLIDYANNLA